MPFIENLKTIFETITAFSTAIIVIITLVKHIPKRIKQFFVKSIPLFFKGTTGKNGKKIRFFRAVKLEKENQNKIKRMFSIIAPNYETDEYFVLNKEELSKMIENSKLFTHISHSMKKKIILSTLLVMFSICSVFTFDWAAALGWHRYTDYKNGYSGIAKSYYIGTTREINPNSFSDYLKQYIVNEGVYYIKSVHVKMSKAEKFILISELNSWDLEDGDVYVVRIQTGYDIQVIIASVDKKCNVTNWYGYDCEVKGV